MRTLSPRETLIAGGSAVVLAACSSGTSTSGPGGRLVDAADPAIERRDALRRKPAAAARCRRGRSVIAPALAVSAPRSVT
jgi:hypothetical protein